jgi:hypothetical protein
MLEGTWKLDLSYNPDVVTVVRPANASMKDIDALLEDTHLDFDGGLPTAIQCYNRGWNQLAQAILVKDLKRKENRKDHFAPKRLLATIGWNYWEGQLIESGTDWSKIAKRLKDFSAIEKTLILSRIGSSCNHLIWLWPQASPSREVLGQRSMP